MIRLTGHPDVVAAAEAMLASVRKARVTARESLARGGAACPPERWAEVDATFAAARNTLVATLRRVRDADVIDDEEEEALASPLRVRLNLGRDEEDATVSAR